MKRKTEVMLAFGKEEKFQKGTVRGIGNKRYENWKEILEEAEETGQDKRRQDLKE